VFTVAFLPAFADEPPAPTPDASSGWPSLPPPSIGDVEKLIKAESKKADSTTGQNSLDIDPTSNSSDSTDAPSSPDSISQASSQSN
jgi:hypothetical protein